MTLIHTEGRKRRGGMGSRVMPADVESTRQFGAGMMGGKIGLWGKKTCATWRALCAKER